MWKLIGQILALGGVLFTVLTYQMRTNRRILIAQSISSLCFCISYFLLGAYPAAVLNIIAIARNLIFSYTERRSHTLRRIAPLLFAVMMALGGMMSWQGPASLLVIVALILNTLALGMHNPRLLRGSILITSPMVLIYNCIVTSYGGIINESLAVVSAIVGLIRYRNKASTK